MAQVCGCAQLSPIVKGKLDDNYVAAMSFRQDLKILSGTIQIVLLGDQRVIASEHKEPSADDDLLPIIRRDSSRPVRMVSWLTI